MASSIPSGYHTITPHLVIKGATEAIEFYASVKPPELMKPPAPRGRHAHPSRKREPKRVNRMNSLERAKRKLELVKARLAALQDGKNNGNIAGSI